MSRRIAGYLAAMLVLGIIAIAGVAALVEWRYGQPLPPPVGVAGIRPGEAPAMAAARGLAASAQSSREHLAAGDRARAMAALDAARRVAGVGWDATSGVLRWAFGAAQRQVEQARIAVTNGNAHAALGYLDEAVTTMRSATSTALPDVSGGPPSPSPPGRRDWPRYRGAILLNAMGVRIGEAVELRRTGAGPPRAILSIGGANNVYGAIDIGGTRTTLPADRLLYGQPNVEGTRSVVAPTFGQTIGTPP